MDESLKEQLINQAGTYIIVESVLTDSRSVKENDPYVPWTAKQEIEYDLNA